MWQKASDYPTLSIDVKSSTDDGENASIATENMEWEETSWSVITKNLP